MKEFPEFLMVIYDCQTLRELVRLANFLQIESCICLLPPALLISAAFCLIDLLCPDQKRMEIELNAYFL
jgi:hypothetical protein